jgi:hypothetical protein
MLAFRCVSLDGGVVALFSLHNQGHMQGRIKGRARRAPARGAKIMRGAKTSLE